MVVEGPEKQTSNTLGITELRGDSLLSTERVSHAGEVTVFHLLILPLPFWVEKLSSCEFCMGLGLSFLLMFR